MLQLVRVVALMLWAVIADPHAVITRIDAVEQDDGSTCHEYRYWIAISVECPRRPGHEYTAVRCGLQIHSAATPCER